MRVLLILATVACNSATTCYAGLTSVIQAAIGPGTAGFTVIILIGLSISRWILTTLCKAFGQETIAGGIDLVLKCVSIGYVINTVWSLVDGTFLRMGF